MTIRHQGRIGNSRSDREFGIQDFATGQMVLIGLLLGFAVLFGGHYRQTEAGPYISVMQDVFPTLAAITVIILSLFNLRSDLLGLRICSLFFILVSGLVIVNVVTLTLRFWSNPYARGDFWSFW